MGRPVSPHPGFDPAESLGPSGSFEVFSGERETLQVLLIQVRDREKALIHERLCFLERLGIDPSRLDSVNIVDGPVPRPSETLRFDLVILGGAGTHAAYQDYPFTAPLLELVLELVERRRPFFGSCFGHQFLARALGGTVELDLEREEVGTFDITLSPDGVGDDLFRGYPGSFPVHLGHHDRVTELPEGLLSLADSDLCPHQVIRVPGSPVYGTQFHCEMSRDHMRERLLMYADEYLRGDDPLSALDRTIRPTRLVDGLLSRFVETYLG
ncbi:MAG: type 1 glutamine amidotransferase [Thermoanaerobaculia bacterium]|nr:type 1 glutamine amidotransferase [Thermoanaerobaculia bacterium]